MKRIYPKDQFDKRLYWIWSAMIQRCHNPANKGFKNYGARGIAVCDRWRTYANFSADVGARTDGLTLERPDNNKGYGPDNFKWANRFVQSGNRRSCIMVLAGDESVPLKEYCRRHGFNYRAIGKRIRNHWSIEDALRIPVGARVWGINRKLDRKPIGNARYEVAFGRTQSVADWAREFNITRGALLGRLHKEWPIEKALTIPMNYRALRTEKAA